jgi:hypothetical protein
MPNQTIAKTSRKPTTRSQKKIEKSRTSRLPRPPVQSQRGGGGAFRAAFVVTERVCAT